MTGVGRLAAALLAATLTLAGCTRGESGTRGGPEFKAGADGAGDPYAPTSGNGGYDVAGYNLDLSYDPASGHLTGTATITATATQDLSRFNLDLATLTASRVTVDGRLATVSAANNELVVTPPAGIRRQSPFTVIVAYAGKPQPLDGGWMRTTDGAFALGEPHSASTWFPVNDHPSDKATFHLTMTVPDGLEVLSNGVPGPRTAGGGRTTWTWTENIPMASYLATVLIGQYRITSGTHRGQPMVTAVPSSEPAHGPVARSLARTGEIADYLATQFGPYPFDAYGGIALNDSRVGYSLETQTRPVYAYTALGGEPVVIVHELAHQWFGDSLSLRRWQDIWLNEGFATYAEWLWLEHAGKRTVAQSFDQQYNGFDWRQTIGDPGAANLFKRAVYQRGAMTLYALRKALGDAAFARLLTTWTAEHRNGNVTTADLIALAERISSKQLDDLFEAWLNGTQRPAHP